MQWDWLNVETDSQVVKANGSFPAIDKWEKIDSPQQAPRRAGVYALIKGETIRYIGETEKLQNRLKDHENDEEKDFDKIAWLQVDGYQRNFIEQLLIGIHGPPDNKEMTKHDRRMFLKETLDTKQEV